MQSILAVTLLTLGLSGSVRSPEIVNDPFDYEVAILSEGHLKWMDPEIAEGHSEEVSFYTKWDFDIAWERESGRIHGNHFLNRKWLWDGKFILAKERYSEAKLLNEQTVVLKYPFLFLWWIVEPGAGVTTENWEFENNPAFAPYFAISNKFMNVKVVGSDREKNKLSHVSGELKYRIPIREFTKNIAFQGFSIIPLFSVYYKNEEKNDYQAKLTVEYDFAGLFGRDR